MESSSRGTYKDDEDLGGTEKERAAWEGGANIERNPEEKIKKKGKKRDRDRRTEGGEGKIGKREGKGNVGAEGWRERATPREMENSAGL